MGENHSAQATLDERLDDLEAEVAEIVAAMEGEGDG